MGSHGAATLAVLLITVMVGTSALVDAACSNSVSGLFVCNDAVMKGGSPPTKQCCTTVTSWGLPCLCSVLSKYANQLPSTVDVQLVMALPKKCGVAVPKGYKCAGYSFPS